MQIIRCNIDHMEYALDAIRTVKHEEDDNPLELITEEAMNIFLSNKSNYLIVAVDEDEVVGFIVAYELQRVDRNLKAMFFYEIGVLRKYRNKGIGTALINYIKEICREKNIMKMWLPTERSNIPAVKLYTKTGGEITQIDDEVTFTWYPPYK